jgi:hypothetical protein
VQSAITDSSGDFVITPVSAGVYSLSVAATGFQTINASNIEVQVGQIVREDLELKVGEATTTIEVYTEVPLLSTDSATLGTVMTNQQVTSLPLNGRGFYKLAELTPGAALLPPTGNSLAIRPEIVNGNTISGIRGSAISFLLDGVDVSEQHQGGTFIQTSIDALQEFSVSKAPILRSSIVVGRFSMQRRSPARTDITVEFLNLSATTNWMRVTISPPREQY